MHRIITILLLLVVALPAMAKKSVSAEEYLQLLDSEIDKRESYQAAKRDKLVRLQALGNSITSEADRFLHNAEIYEECFTCDSELAMKVVKENQEIARRRQDQDALIEWQIKESFLLASTGQFLESVAALDGINASKLPHNLQLNYYDQMQYLYSHMNQYSWTTELKDHYSQLNSIYNDSIYAITEITDPDFLLTLCRWIRVMMLCSLMS